MELYMTALGYVPQDPNPSRPKRAILSLRYSDDLREPVKTAPSQDSVEAVLMRLWCEILGVESVGPDEDFFDLGGTSLSVIILMAAIDEALAVAVELEVLFMSPTISAQAMAIESILADGVQVAA